MWHHHDHIGRTLAHIMYTYIHTEYTIVYRDDCVCVQARVIIIGVFTWGVFFSVGNELTNARRADTQFI